MNSLIVAVQRSEEYWNLYSRTCDYLTNLLFLFEFCNNRTTSSGTEPGLKDSVLVYILTRLDN